MSKGFTLIEILVVLAVIGVISVLVIVAFPNVRESQKLILVEQQFQGLLREAQQQTINEERDPVCAALFPPRKNDPLYEQRYCSDIGVHLTDTEFILFADKNKAADNTWEPTTDGGKTGDFELRRLAYPDGVRFNAAASSTTTFIFEGAPPVVELFKAGTPPTRVTNTPERAIFEVGGSSVSLNVHSYGQVQRN